MEGEEHEHEHKRGLSMLKTAKGSYPERSSTGPTRHISFGSYFTKVFREDPLHNTSWNTTLETTISHSSSDEEASTTSDDKMDLTLPGGRIYREPSNYFLDDESSILSEESVCGSSRNSLLNEESISPVRPHMATIELACENASLDGIISMKSPCDASLEVTCVNPRFPETSLFSKTGEKKVATSYPEKALASHAGDWSLECHFGDDDEDDDYFGEDHRYGTFYCPTCGMSFHRQDNLKRYQRVHVNDEMGVTTVDQGHICNVCGDSFPEALDLLAHAEVHPRPEHRCMICGEDFEHGQDCAVHVQVEHGHDLPPHTCMLCGRLCKDRRSLLEHSWEHSTNKAFSCNKTTETFMGNARLKSHLVSYRSKAVTCDVCGEEFTDDKTLMNHRRSHSNLSGRQFPCEQCGKTFASRSSQQRHTRIHTGVRPYRCRFCTKAFVDGSTLKKHERIHNGEKPYACAVCSGAFNQRVTLREHIRTLHSGPDPRYTDSMTAYCCAVCSDLFTTSQDLILHLIDHCDMNTAMKRQQQIG